MNRKETLEKLLNLEGEIGALHQNLKSYSWDSDIELVLLNKTHIVNVLSAYMSGVIVAEEVEKWANAIESREDIGYEKEDLKETIWELANPLLSQELTKEIAKAIITNVK